MQSLRFHYSRCIAAGLLCLLLVSCGESTDPQDDSVQGQLQRAVQIGNLRMRNKKLLEIAEIQFQQKDPLHAEETIELAVATAMKIKDPYGSAAGLNSAAFVYGKHKLVDQANDLLKTVYEKSSEVTEVDQRVLLLAKMGEIQHRFLDDAGTGDDILQEAATLAEDAEVAEEKVRAKMNLAFYSNRLDRSEERDELIEHAFVALEGLSDQRKLIQSAADLGSRLAKMDCQEQADQAFQLAEEGAAKIEDFCSRGHLLCEVSDHMGRVKRKAAAQRILDEVLQLAEDVKDDGLRNELLQKTEKQRVSLQ